MQKRSIITMAWVVLTLMLGACANIGYYVHCATGHWGVMNRCRPIKDVLADEKTPAELKVQLAKVQSIRRFASSAMQLPDNDSYRSYGDLDRPFVVWNVVAAPEFSLQPKQWCFPVAGCVSYRGYFSKDKADGFARKLRKKGLDVHVYGVTAYSTLNWFDDPVLNTFLDRPESAIAGLIFHELTHQVVYVENDSRFNEAFATVVEVEGVRRYLRSMGDSQQETSFEQGLERHRLFIDLLTGLRDELGVLYSSSLGRSAMQQEKDAILDRAQSRYETLKERMEDYRGFDPFFEGGLNNAKLTSVSTYHDLVPAFQRLLDEQGGDLPSFYRAVATIGELPKEQRQLKLAALLPADGHVAEARGVTP